jgi:hypothetical protein
MENVNVPLTIIEEYFKNNPVPADYQPDSFMRILDHKKFIDSHINLLKANPKNMFFMPYYERLLKFYIYCQTKKS